MKKSEFLRLMKFPDQWETLGMYPDDLFLWQLAGYRPGHEDGCEHDRNGAFHWWLRREPAHDHLKNLLLLAALDPDRHLGSDVREHIARAKAYDSDLAALAAKLFA